MNRPSSGQTARQVAVTGASGLIGQALTASLKAGGHRVRAVVRSRQAAGEGAIFWNPSHGEIDAAALEGIDAVVHLAGENLAAGRWTEARKDRILRSRTDGTRVLCEALARLERRPEVLVSASAVGFYGDRGHEPIDETSPRGQGFLAEVCQKWEAATTIASQAGIRVVNARFGVVLSPDGGALKKMLPVFKLGLGGRLGSGDQGMSWIALDDTVAAIERALFDESLSGPVNIVSPNPVTNARFTEVLGRVLHRPARLSVPPVALKLGLGSELAEEALLTGQCIVPDRLMKAGFVWKYPDLETALHHLLGR